LDVLALIFGEGSEDDDGGRVFIPLETFAHALLEIHFCFSGRSLPHLIITFRPARLTRLPWADKPHKNHRLWRVVNMGFLFELTKPSGNAISHRELLSLREVPPLPAAVDCPTNWTAALLSATKKNGYYERLWGRP
jgi:hypothetical protein